MNIAEALLDSFTDARVTNDANPNLTEKYHLDPRNHNLSAKFPFAGDAGVDQRDVITGFERCCAPAWHRSGKREAGMQRPGVRPNLKFRGLRSLTDTPSLKCNVFYAA